MWYKFIQRVLPGGPGRGKKRSFISFSHSGHVSFDRLLSGMSRWKGGLSPGDLYRLLERLNGCLLAELQRGNTVEVKGLGHFSLSIKYKNQPDEEQPSFSRRNIEDIKVVFRPSKEMKIDPEKIRFDQIRTLAGRDLRIR